ncbi:protein of unknown function DUF955 [Candidatus Koribacter versatilis Ellin345]|uniref:IrrE N-terminal-like domain-containing protein n=1 Tax=Koribacter versatilis (strain Ellin345) TaxID=204669 RepID=Q1ISM6_KORVE|nr:ImmA/IrrE family metallo-endopeptidase [Candidatus Koribacter versatilis]ABF40124.1 protein of unknown function DUF955 [Candidatus Koribacter versatilis Ellin345]
MSHTCQLPDPEKMAVRVLERAEVSVAPVNLRRVIALWKNLYLVEEDLDGSGYLLPMGNLGAEIIVNKNDSPERKAFTVAHEMGHWILGLRVKKSEGEFKQPDVPHHILERWCDSFATGLLMPRHLLESAIPQKESAALLHSVLQASQKFGVSEEAFFIRIWQVLRIQVAFINLLPTQNRGKFFDIERQFAERRYVKKLEDLLSVIGVEGELKSNNAVILFSINGDDGRKHCTGRKLSDKRVLLTIQWPESTNGGVRNELGLTASDSK